MQALAGVHYEFKDKNGRSILIRDFRVTQQGSPNVPRVIEGTIEPFEDLVEYNRGYDDGASWGYADGDADGFLDGISYDADELTGD